jgi:hypothetical protein
VVAISIASSIIYLLMGIPGFNVGLDPLNSVDVDASFPTVMVNIPGKDIRETLNGSDGPDNIDGDGKDDKIYGFGGDDVLKGGSGEGEDTINAGAGNDQLFGQGGDEALRKLIRTSIIMLFPSGKTYADREQKSNGILDYNDIRRIEWHETALPLLCQPQSDFIDN